MNRLWRLELLGRIRARGQDSEVDRFATTRAAALLARLVLNPNRAHPREELADLLWPDSDAQASRLNLRVTLASLRRQLEPPGSETSTVFLADRTFIRLRPGTFDCDVLEFEAALVGAGRASTAFERRQLLDLAVGLYGGELLPGLYDEWIVDERTRLEALLERAQEQLQSLPRVPESVQAVATNGKTDAAGIPRIGEPNLPHHLTRFFGREPEIAGLSELLSNRSARLVTIIGPAGVGKSRFAIEATRRVTAEFGGRITFVGLADISDGSLLAIRIADTLRIKLAPEQSILEQIGQHLGRTRSMLLLDNLEHLGDEAALQTKALLGYASGLTCLCTSQHRLGIEGEHEVVLSPLPAPGQEEPIGLLAGSDAVQLFVNRAQIVRPDFQVTSANFRDLGEICRRLDSLPLALELAAARVNVVSVSQMLEQLNTLLDFVTSRRRDLAPRHRSLRAALEWSVQLLDKDLAQFFRKLSVFRGGWQLEAASAVTGVDGCLDLMEQLRERSLIVSEEGRSGMRFRMLESLREFCQEQLTESERQELSRRHADYLAQLARRVDAMWYGPRQQVGSDLLEAETDNLRSALAFCLEDVRDEFWDGGEVGVKLTGCLGRYWTVRGMAREAVEWLEKTISRPNQGAPLARALRELGWLAANLGNFVRAEQALEESIAISRVSWDPGNLGAALRLRGTVAVMQAHYDESRVYLEEAVRISRAIGDELNVARTLITQASLHEREGRNPLAAKQLYEDALVVLRKHGDRQNASYCVHNLGNIARAMGERALAESRFRESLAMAIELGDVWNQSYCLLGLGIVMNDQGNAEGARDNLEQALKLAREVADLEVQGNAVDELAYVAQKQGDFDRAQMVYHEALAIRREMDDPLGLASSWIGLAEIALESKRFSQAVSCLAKASLCNDADFVGPLTARAAAACSAALDAFGPADCNAAWEQALDGQSGARWLQEAMAAHNQASRKAKK